MVFVRDKCRFGLNVHYFIVLDNTLASKTHTWTCWQACKDEYKANGWHTQAW